MPKMGKIALLYLQLLRNTESLNCAHRIKYIIYTIVYVAIMAIDYENKVIFLHNTFSNLVYIHVYLLHAVFEYIDTLVIEVMSIPK